MKILIIISILLLPVCAFGEEVVNYSQCELKEGKTLADVSTFFDEWKVTKTKAGIDFSVRILTPHAAKKFNARTFLLVGNSSNFKSYGEAYEWWYTDKEAMVLIEKFNEIGTCTSGSIYRVSSTH